MFLKYLSYSRFFSFQSPYKYFSMVIITSIVLKLPRFFHFTTITIDGKPQYWTTHIMENPVYIRFSSYWDDLIVTGFLPLMVTIFFNLRIYLQVIEITNEYFAFNFYNNILSIYIHFQKNLFIDLLLFIYRLAI